jgi:hypothetical protein
MNGEPARIAARSQGHLHDPHDDIRSAVVRLPRFSDVADEALSAHGHRRRRAPTRADGQRLTLDGQEYADTLWSQSTW